MQDQGAGIEADQNVLGAPVDAANRLIADGGLEVGGNGPAQAPLAHDEFDHAPLQ